MLITYYIFSSRQTVRYNYIFELNHIEIENNSTDSSRFRINRTKENIFKRKKLNVCLFINLSVND